MSDPNIHQSTEVKAPSTRVHTVQRPQNRIAANAAARRAYLQQSLNSGTYVGGPNHPNTLANTQAATR